jgi:hypothetical protein
MAIRKTFKEKKEILPKKSILSRGEEKEKKKKTRIRLLYRFYCGTVMVDRTADAFVSISLNSPRISLWIVTAPPAPTR